MSARNSLDTAADVMTHLASGNLRQQQAYHILQDSGIMETLSSYCPYPAGTVPIDIDLPGSDLDILCYAEDLHAFEAATRSMLEDISVKRRLQWKHAHHSIDRQSYVTCNLQVGAWPVEIYAQKVPVYEQNAYLHMLVEWRLLQLWGDAGHRELRRLKRAGWKTEPAFASILGLDGNPYEELRHLASMHEQDLRDWAIARTSIAFP